jgi:Rrf2 family iron-sulfur cluster assembly transcriptional regulator
MENCQDEHKCLTHDLWSSLNNHIFDYLKHVKLSRLVNDQHERIAKARTVAVPVQLREHSEVRRVPQADDVVVAA